MLCRARQLYSGIPGFDVWTDVVEMDTLAVLQKLLRCKCRGVTRASEQISSNWESLRRPQLAEVDSGRGTIDIISKLHRVI